MIGMNLLNYEIKSELGRGGMAIVYLAEHNLTGEKVAVKVLNADLVKNENIRKRFVSEARNLAQMSHRNIVKVHDLFEDHDTVAFVMDCIQGQSLKELLESTGKMSDYHIKDIFLQMLDALTYVHQYGLVHRDVKPSNFMLDHQNNLFLMDFGIAKIMDASAAEYTSTGTGTQLGTPMYMSPEQVAETRNVTFHTDIYSLGVVLWQMVTGDKPYDIQSTSNFELQTKIVNEPLPFTHTKWDYLIQKATQKNPQNRYNSTLDFRKQALNPSDSNSGDKTIFEGGGSNKTVFEGGNSDKTIYESTPFSVDATVEPPQKSESKNRPVATYIRLFVICLVIVGTIIYNMGIDNSSSSGSDLDTREATVSEEGSNSVPLNESDQSSTVPPAEEAASKSNYKNSNDGYWPSIDEQANVIRDMYSSFDNSYTYEDISNYLNTYYDYTCRQKFSFELKSYSKYNSKNHIIISINLDQYRSTSSIKYYRVDFKFEFERTKDGIFQSRYCHDFIGLDQNNNIVDRIEGTDC